MDQYQKHRVCILVKAYPQPSQRYQETVCVAAVTEDHRLLRLYPIRFRHLAEEQRFGRFDWVETEMTRASDDPRPESFRIKEDTLRILTRGDKVTPVERVRLWKPCIAKSLAALEDEQREMQRSLGIIRPDDGSVHFKFELLERASADDQDTARSVYVQQSLIEESLTPLPDRIHSTNLWTPVSISALSEDFSSSLSTSLATCSFAEAWDFRFNSPCSLARCRSSYAVRSV